VEELDQAKISPAPSIDHYTQDGEKTTSTYRGVFVPDIDTAPAGDDVSLQTAWQAGRLLALNNNAVAIQLIQQREAAKLQARRQTLQNAAADGTPPVHADKAPAAVMHYIAEKLKGVFL
jgi:hypothetical protein